MLKITGYSNYFYRKLINALGMLLGVIALGTIGYELLEEEFTFVDSFYMTIITISTVGFREVHELSDTGKIFTAFLIISSFGIFAYSVTSITTFIMSGNYRKHFIENKMLKQISHLSGHTIVCGFGRVGRKATRELLDHDEKVIVIEQNEDVFKGINDYNGLLHIIGDSTDDVNLEEAGIVRAKAIITTLPNDSENLFVVLSARELCPEILIISRASNPATVKKLKIAGASNVIMPDIVGGSHMASLVITPDINEFLDNISIQGEADVNLEEVAYTNVSEDSKYMTLKELAARKKLGVNIIGFKTPNGDYIINPGPDTIILPNSKLFVLGTAQQISVLNNLLNEETV
jgi:voltage-gated potassium channel